MGLLILVVILTILSCVAIVLCNGDVVEPLSLSFESFTLSAFIAFCYNGFHLSDISSITIIIEVTALLVYMVGYMLMKEMMRKAGVFKYSKRGFTFREPPKFFSFLCLFIEICIVAMVFRATLLIARGVNGNATIWNMLMYARNAYLFSDASMGGGLSIASFFVIALGYFYTYIEVYNIVVDRKDLNYLLRECKIELSIIIASLFSGMMGTGRTFLIQYIVFLFIAYYYTGFLVKRKKKVSFQEVVKYIKQMVIVLVIFFGVFQILGLLTGKTGTLSATDMLYGYSGAATVAFDRSIEIYHYDGRFWGEESFYGLYGFLNALGVDIPNNILHLPFVDVGNGFTTNIYTSLRTYIYDFGFIGLYIVQFLLGIISALLYALLFRYNMHPIYLMIYGIFMYGIVMQGIEEMTLRSFMGITNVFLIVFFSILYMITQQRKVTVKWIKKK